MNIPISPQLVVPMCLAMILLMAIGAFLIGIGIYGIVTLWHGEMP
jgi:preprotein translocase subunit Sec61beta